MCRKMINHCFIQVLLLIVPIPQMPSIDLFILVGKDYYCLGEIILTQATNEVPSGILSALDSRWKSTRPYGY